MNNKPNTKLIGLFTIIGITIIIGIIITSISKNFFNKDDDKIVMYFQESINGLSIGSPVLFRGVEIGKVSKIDLMTNTNNMNFSIAVFATLNETQTFRVQDFSKINNREEFFNDLINSGLRARLVTQSYLTGQMMIELEILPNSQLILSGKEHFKNTIEIPTVLSPISEISQGLQDLPIKEMMQKFNILIDDFNKNFPTFLNQITEMSLNFNKILNNNIGNISITFDNLNKTLVDIGEAARSMKNLTDYLDRHPEALLKGKGRGEY